MPEDDARRRNFLKEWNDRGSHKCVDGGSFIDGALSDLSVRFVSFGPGNQSDTTRAEDAVPDFVLYGPGRQFALDVVEDVARDPALFFSDRQPTSDAVGSSSVLRNEHRTKSRDK